MSYFLADTASMTGFLRSVSTGFVGLWFAVRSEPIMRMHVAIAFAVVVGGFVIRLAAWEWIVVVLCIGLVIAGECANTALERLADRVSLERHPLIKQAKDCSSAAVLTLSIMAAIVGCIVFGPKLWAATGW